LVAAESAPADNTIPDVWLHAGGNILFATVPAGISSMALLTFAFLDYATFVVSGVLGACRSIFL
jgi:hypothetical protein